MRYLTYSLKAVDGLASRPKSPNVKHVAPTAIVSRLLREASGGDLGEVNLLLTPAKTS